MNSEQFIQELCKRFPSLKNDILDEDYQRLFSLQISIFRNYTQSCIDNGDFKKVDECINFIFENFNNLDSKVENSIVLSYIGKLDFKNYPIPKLLKEFKEALDSYNNSALNNQKLVDVLKKIGLLNKS